MNELKFAAELHEQVPPNWYHQSIKVDFLQRFWHKRRFEEVSMVLEPTHGKILDLGSADGTFSKVILDKTGASEFIGLDAVKSSVDWANRHWRKVGKMKFFVRDAHNLGFEPNTFDAVFALEVLEHVHNPKKVLMNLKKVLKKGGYGVFLIPSDSLLFRIIWYLWLHFYPRGWVWRDTHIQTYRNNYLSRLCRQIGFRLEVDRKFNLGMLHLVKVRKI